MRDKSDIIRERQLAIARELKRRGIALKVLAYDSGIKYDTLCSYFPGGERQPAEMPCSAAFALCGVLPDDLLNLLCPDNYALVRVPSGIDHDDICEWAEMFTAKKLAAHRADSEHEERIGPNEKAELDAVVVAFPGKAA